MEFFTYRNFLQMTELLSWVACAYGLVLGVVGLLAPALSRRGARPALAGAGAPVDGGSELDGGSGRVLDAGSRMLVVLVLLCFALAFGANVLRYMEVRHWPAQTMYEVIPMGVTAGYLSTIGLLFVLGIHRMRGSARAFGDLFLALILFGGAFTTHYVLGLDPTGKPLPPALQSYWFSTHITAYMVGYFTLFIAAVGAFLHFTFQFWRGMLDRANHPAPRLVMWGVPLLVLAASPFGGGGMALGVGILALTGGITWANYRFAGGMPWFDRWQSGADRFTWLIFVVGFPFLTSGLVQGSLWAQEAWANYWAWDSKEVSALISWVFYAVYLHLRYVAGWRGEKGMMLLCAGALSIFITFQLFGYLPDSQKSLHRYTDMESVPSEGMMQPPSAE